MAKRKASTGNVSEVRKLQKEMEHIYKTVYHGNGTPSLTNQVTKLDSKLSSLSDSINNKFSGIEKEMELKFTNITEIVNEKFNNISFQIQQEFEKKRSESHQKIGFKTAIITSALASITSLVVVILTEWLKRLG